MNLSVLEIHSSDVNMISRKARDTRKGQAKKEMRYKQELKNKNQKHKKTLNTFTRKSKSNRKMRKAENTRKKTDKQKMINIKPRGSKSGCNSRQTVTLSCLKDASLALQIETNQAKNFMNQIKRAVRQTAIIGKI